MGKNYNRPALIAKDAVSGFCPGCTHGTIHKLIAEVIEEMHMEEDTIRCLGIGCSGLGTKYLQLDYINCAHGRALAAATAVKRLNPDKLVLPIRVTETLRPSDLRKQFQQLQEEKMSRSSS